jgi:chorismate mutase / prephenate dehydrogenase
MAAAPKELTSHRRRIERVDAEIARGVAKRLRLARDLASTKSRAGLPLRNYRVEAGVVGRWVRALQRAGVDPARSEALARWLIEESVRVQEPIVHHPLASRRGRSQEIGVVGGAGAMGKWLCEFFESNGHRVSVVDPRADPKDRPIHPNLPAALSRVDVLVFATPIEKTAELLREALAPATPVLIFDVLSVKAPVAELLMRGARAGRRVTSVHPMFGPSARTLSGRNLLIVGCGNSEADGAARALFARSALTLTDVSLAEHDRLMAASLGLSHAVNLLFLGALPASGVSSDKLSRVASTTFHRQSSLALSVAREGVELYLEIQASNPHSREVYRTIRSRLETLERIVERRDRAAFREWLDAGRSLLDSGPAPMRA